MWAGKLEGQEGAGQVGGLSLLGLAVWTPVYTREPGCWAEDGVLAPRKAERGAPSLGPCCPAGRGLDGAPPRGGPLLGSITGSHAALV